VSYSNKPLKYLTFDRNRPSASADTCLSAKNYPQGDGSHACCGTNFIKQTNTHHRPNGGNCCARLSVSQALTGNGGAGGGEISAKESLCNPQNPLCFLQATALKSAGTQKKGGGAGEKERLALIKLEPSSCTSDFVAPAKIVSDTPSKRSWHRASNRSGT